MSDTKKVRYEDHAHGFLDSVKAHVKHGHEREQAAISLQIGQNLKRTAELPFATLEDAREFCNKAADHMIEQSHAMINAHNPTKHHD